MGGTSSRTSSTSDEYQSVEQKIKENMNLKHEHTKLLKESLEFSWNIAELPENARKNRDLNMCFNHNRVVLPGIDGSDFINASWIDGYKAPGRFVLCQAPLRETVQDWWTMILAYKIRVIVMLNGIVEQDQEACFPYRSQVRQTSVNFGEFSIKNKKVKVLKDHVVTNLRVTDGNGASLDVEQCAYTDWPSEGVPQNPSGFYKFLVKVRKAQAKAEHHQSSIFPMLVHSRTGLNRAGAFVAIDICLTQFNDSKTIDLASMVRSLLL